ncbi:MAG: peptidase M54 [bacterium]
MRKPVVFMVSRGVPSGVIRTLKREVPAVFGAPVRIERGVDVLDGAYNESRRQYDAIRVIRNVLDAAPETAAKAIAVVNEDLFIPVLTHVIGEAQLGGSAGALSIFRLRLGLPGGGNREAVFRRRVLVEAVHELGHTFGLTHCGDFLCPMSVSTGSRHVDRKSTAPCASCRFLLDGTPAVPAADAPVSNIAAGRW